MSEPRISLEETRHVAKLSKLHFEEAELQSLNAEMEAILETVSQLQRVPVEGLEATLGVGSYANRFRDDQVEPTMAASDALSNAPAQRDGCFEIVRILSKTEE
jgi:aspartyl-tRNA(Asn)/glutamyl-tRNA(Gln) amidotransferase subunit C